MTTFDEGLPEYLRVLVDCPTCNNSGQLVRRSGGVLTARECPCMAKRRDLLRIQKSGLERLMEDYTFDKFQAVEEWQKNAKNTAKAYAAFGDGWFLICGKPGTGKTHICTAICKVLMEMGMSVRYELWRELAPSMKASVNDREEYTGMMNKLKSIDVLYLDDFLKTRKSDDNRRHYTDADVNFAFELINARYVNRKRTIISTELSIGEIMEVDEAMGSRIAEMAKGYIVKAEGENWRLK